MRSDRLHERRMTKLRISFPDFLPFRIVLFFIRLRTRKRFVRVVKRFLEGVRNRFSVTEIISHQRSSEIIQSDNVVESEHKKAVRFFALPQSVRKCILAYDISKSVFFFDETVLSRHIPISPVRSAAIVDARQMQLPFKSHVSTFETVERKNRRTNAFFSVFLDRRIVGNPLFRFKNDFYIFECLFRNKLIPEIADRTGNSFQIVDKQRR